MTIDRSISAGNIVSWVMIVVAVTAGYTKIQSATTQNAKDVAAAIARTDRIEEAARASDARRDAQINSLTVDVAVTKSTVTSIDKKVDELMRR